MDAFQDDDDYYECSQIDGMESNVIKEELPMATIHGVACDEVDIDHEMPIDGMKFECVRILKMSVYF